MQDTTRTEGSKTTHLRDEQRKGIEWGLAHTTGEARERWLEQQRKFEEGKR